MSYATNLETIFGQVIIIMLITMTMTLIFNSIESNGDLGAAASDRTGKKAASAFYLTSKGELGEISDSGLEGDGFYGGLFDRKNYNEMPDTSSIAESNSVSEERILLRKVYNKSSDRNFIVAVY